MVNAVIRIALVCASVVLWAGVAEAAGPKRIPIAQRKFDHARHEVAAQKSATCKDCHQMDASGVRKKGKEHGHRCVKCHNDPATCTSAMKSSAVNSPGRRCVVCHVMDKCKPPNLPPPPASRTFQASFQHGAHMGFGAAIERECATCHKNQAPAGAATGAAGVGHSLCSDCHKVGGRSKVNMTNCEGCHQAPKAAGGGTAATAWSLSKFDHRKHHLEATRNQANCLNCHSKDKMVGAGGAAVPRPDMLTCQNQCHNGTKAFSAVGTRCTSCHQPTVAGAATPNRTDIAFSHAKHGGRNVNIKNCEACHTAKEDGNLEPPGAGKNHMPCAASGCHQTEYASKTTKICGVCHDKSAPWEKAVARMNETPSPEWFENINHATHLQKKGATNSACGDCHGDKLGGAKRPRGHDACSQCHGKGPPAHPMSDCGKCHVQTPPQRMAVSEWSVAAMFVHEKHANNPKTKQPAQCVQCHADVKNAKDLATIKKPTMPSCDGCHDGKTSFKTTGYECYKCHTRKKQPSTPTAFEGFNSDPTAMLRVVGRRGSGQDTPL
jgi:hypothetical protein